MCSLTQCVLSLAGGCEDAWLCNPGSTKLKLDGQHTDGMEFVMCTHTFTWYRVAYSQARVTTEDPTLDFRPDTGRIQVPTRFRWR